MEGAIIGFLERLQRLFSEHPEEQDQIISQTNLALQQMEEGLGEPLAIENGAQPLAAQPLAVQAMEEYITIENPREGDVFKLKFKPDDPLFKYVQVWQFEDIGTRVVSFDINEPNRLYLSTWTTQGLGLNRNNTTFIANYPKITAERRERNPTTGATRYLAPNEESRFPYDFNWPAFNTPLVGGRRTSKRYRRKRQNKKRGKSRKTRS